jgi:hypothetical protein
VCFACPLGNECTPAIRAKHLRSDLCQWRKMSAVANDGYDRLRDARELYRSNDESVKAVLKASLDWR